MKNIPSDALNAASTIVYNKIDLGDSVLNPRNSSNNCNLNKDNTRLKILNSVDIKSIS